MDATIPIAQDRQEAQRALSRLDATTDQFTFQTYDDNRDRNDPKLARVLHGSLHQHWRTLVNLNNRGAGVSVTVNRTNLSGRSTEDIEAVRAFFSDLDGAPLQPVLAAKLKPHMVVETSPGHWHPYWMAEGLDDLNEFPIRQELIALMFDGDPQVNDLAKPMRLPGFLHMKNPAEPHLVRLHMVSDHAPYPADNFKMTEEQRQRWLPRLMPRWLRERCKVDYGKGVSFDKCDLPLRPRRERVMAALAVIDPADVSRRDWIKCGFGLHTDFGEDGFQMWDEWSAGGGNKYKPFEMRYQYRSIARKNKYKVRVGSIFWMAKQIDPDWSQRYFAGHPDDKDDYDPDDEGADIQVVDDNPLADEQQPPATSAVQTTPTNRVLIHGGDFATNFTPPDYLIYKLLQRGNLYSMTGMTGNGKTAVALLMAVYVALGRAVGGMDTEKGRVLYFAGENPDDVRMRYIRMCEVMNLDPHDLDIHFLEGAKNLSDQQLRLRISNEAVRLGGASLIIVDTSAAYFVADNKNNDENDAVQALKHAKMLRTFTQLPGKPTVLVTCHPVKSADPNNLLPRGGGAFVNEVDGNLAVIREDRSSPLIKVDTHGKFRGPEFNPFSFKLVSSALTGLKDSKGRDIWTVHAEPVGDVEENRMEHAFHDRGLQLMQAMLNRPQASIPALAEALGWVSVDGSPQKSTVHRLLKELERGKKVVKDGPHWTITAKGKKALAQAPASVADDRDIPF